MRFKWSLTNFDKYIYIYVHIIHMCVYDSITKMKICLNCMKTLLSSQYPAVIMASEKPLISFLL